MLSSIFKIRGESMIGIYGRQSLDKKDSISIETQIEICKKEFSPTDKFKVYQDKGYSGKNTKRPAFANLMEDIANGNIEKLVVYRLDRISRSITDFAEIMEFLQKNDVDFISANEKFDTSTAMGRAMVYIVMVFAQLERETTAERVKDNYYSRGKTGVWLGGPAPYGFKNTSVFKDGKKMATIVPTEEIETIKRIFDMYAYSEKALGSIAKELRSSIGGMWNNIKLSRIIQNPAYVKADADIYNFYYSKKSIIVDDVDKFVGEKGCNLYGKRESNERKYRNLNEHVLSLSLHDGIIDSRTWLLCQAKIAKNRQIKNSGKGKHTWLTGLVKCGYCGYATRITRYNDLKYIRCSGRLSVNSLCKEELETHYLNDIEENVSNEIVWFLKNHQNKEESPNDIKNTQDIESNEIKIRIIKIDKQIEALINSLTEMSETTAKYVNEKILALDIEKNELIEKANSLAVAPADVVLPDEEEWINQDMEGKRIIAQQIIDKVLLFDDKIEIAWKL